MIITSVPPITRGLHFSLSRMYLQRRHFFLSWSRATCTSSGERALAAIGQPGGKRPALLPLGCEIALATQRAVNRDRWTAPSHRNHPPSSPTNSFGSARFPPEIKSCSYVLARITARILAVAAAAGIAASAALSAPVGPSVAKLTRPGCP